MLALKLLTYKNKKCLKEIHNSDEKNEVIMLNEIDNDLDEGISYFVDITSIGDALFNLKNNHGLLFQVEQNLLKLHNNNNITFITKEDYKDVILDNLPLIFDSSESINSSDDDTDESKDKDDKKIKKISDLSSEELNDLINNFNEKLIGHNNFKKILKENLIEFNLFNNLDEHKILSIFIFGDSGIGKTEVARILHKSLAPSEKMIKISFGNYVSQGSLNSLIGSPRGYIGSEDGELNLKIENSRSSIILIDEFEKADKSVLNFFLELLEEGKYTDMLGNEHDLNGYVIIFTSNLNENTLCEKLSPEFYNRLNLKIKFNLLNEEDKKKYLNRRISELSKKYNKISNSKLSQKDLNILKEINVSKYNSIRDIENEIKKTFIQISKKCNIDLFK